MDDDGPKCEITRESLRDGSLIEAARLRVPAGMKVRSDVEIRHCLDTILASHPGTRTSGCSATAR